MRPAQRHQIGPARVQDRVDLARLRDRPHRHHRHARHVADRLGELHLEHAAIDRLLVGHRLPGRGVHQVAAGFGERLGHREDVVLADPALDPIRRRHPHRHRLARWPHLPHRLEHLERKAQPVLDRAAILVRPPVRQRREKRRQQIPMRAMKLDHVEPRPLRPHRGLAEIGHDPVHIRPLERLRHLADPIMIGDRRRRDDRPVLRRQRLIHLLPAQLRRALPPRVTQLQHQLALRIRMHEVGDPFPPGLMLVRPQPGAARRDPRIRRRARHLGEHQPGPTQRMRRVMHEMPIGRIAVRIGRILRHRRHRDPVLDHHLAQLEPREHRRRPALAIVVAALAIQPLIERRIDPGAERRVAHQQIVVGDRLGPAHDHHGELLRAHIPRAVHMLEPGQRDVRIVLNDLARRAPLLLVGFERRLDIRFGLGD